MSRWTPTVLQALLQRRSVRDFTDQDVSLKDIRCILDAGRWAPSGLNNQPWRFLVLREGDPRKRALEGCTQYAQIVRRAKVLIGVFLWEPAMYHEGKDHQAAGACIQNMLLAIHGLGLGGVWLGEIINQESAVFDVLKLDQSQLRLMAFIALGHPARPGPAQPGSSTRRELSELLLEDF